MKGYLLDTHTVLWTLFETKALSTNTRKIIENTDNLIYVSSVTFWEIAIKVSLNKLSLSGCQVEDLPKLVTEMGFLGLPLSVEVASSFRLPRLTHKDPFDRMLIWQAISHQLVLVSCDDAFAMYETHGLMRVW